MVRPAVTSSPDRALVLRERGAVIPLRVGFSRADEAAARASGRPVPAPVAVRALVDTGSGRSIVQRDLARELDLRPVGRVEIDTPSSVDLAVPEYYVRFWFDDLTGPEVKVIEAPLRVPRVRALIGRDLLERAHFEYDGPTGRFELRFPRGFV